MELPLEDEFNPRDEELETESHIPPPPHATPIPPSPQPEGK